VSEILTQAEANEVAAMLKNPEAPVDNLASAGPVDPDRFRLLIKALKLKEPQAPRPKLEGPELDAKFDELDLTCDLRVGDLYIHYGKLNNDAGPKNVYQIVRIGLDSDTLEPTVGYVDLSAAERRTWFRKLASWNKPVLLPGGVEVERYRHVGWAPVQELT